MMDGCCCDGIRGLRINIAFAQNGLPLRTAVIVPATAVLSSSLSGSAFDFFEGWR